MWVVTDRDENGKFWVYGPFITIDAAQIWGQESADTPEVKVTHGYSISYMTPPIPLPV